MSMLELSAATVFYDGLANRPSLHTPEGVAIDADGNVWCGGGGGELYRLAPDGSAAELVATTDGFVLGIAFDRAGRLYACDLFHRTVFRYDPAAGELADFPKLADGQAIRTPNFPVVDHERGCLYVSDSNEHHVPGGGVWRLDLGDGRGELWYGEPLNFANGMALTPAGDALYVAESWAHRVVRIPIGADGSAGTPEPVIEDIHGVVDGLVVDREGTLYLAQYVPSRIARVTAEGTLEIVIDDPYEHILCHPTNAAFSGDRLLTANLGAHHLTEIAIGIEGNPLL
jgi:gluconolactonase